MPWFLTSPEKKVLLFVGLLALCGVAVLGIRRLVDSSNALAKGNARNAQAQVRQRIVEKDRQLDENPVRPSFDLNAVSERDLLRIPSMGHVTANRIVQYRRLKGSFTEIAELDRVPGIGQARMKQIAPYLYVATPQPENPQASQPSSVPLAVHSN